MSKFYLVFLINELLRTFQRQLNIYTLHFKISTYMTVTRNCFAESSQENCVLIFYYHVNKIWCFNFNQCM